MELGIITTLTEHSISPADLARAVDGRGFTSLFLPEHTHIPTSCRTGPTGADLPEEYRRLLDPFLALAVAAAASDFLLVGTGVCLAAQHDPIVLAKQVATLDLLSGGRVLLGVGAGWNVAEAANHGVSAPTRWARLREHILAMKAIWTTDEAEFHGEFVNFGPLWQWPKPVAAPHPPILVAGDGARALERVLEYGDGWIPLVRGRTEEEVIERMAALAALAAERGRNPLPVTIFGCPQQEAAVAAYRDAGAARCLFWLPMLARDEMLRALDDVARLAVHAV